jgi:DNA-binding SARP family transcriptional activator
VELRNSDGVLLRLPTRPTAVLLAMLALEEGREWVRDEIAAEVWEGKDRKAAREGLRTALSWLRKLLPSGAIRTVGDRVSLTPGVVLVFSFESAAGEFMPGYETAWAIDRRLAQRARFVAEALTLAEMASDPAEALVHAERACALDPLDERAEALRARLLRRLGRRGEAQIRMETHQARVSRDLGAAPDEHPLVAAIEWSLVRDPEDACTMLAGAQDLCRGLSIERALRLYRRVLGATTKPSSARRIVESGEAFFSVMADPCTVRNGNLRRLYQAARADGEMGLAGMMAEALTYGNLSLGEFDAAVVYAKARLDLAHQGDRKQAVRALLDLGIVELHVGDSESSFRHIDAAVAKIELGGNAYAVLEAHNTQIGFWIHRGMLDKASRALSDHQQRVQEYGSERLYAWTYDLEARIYELTGDLDRAHQAYLRFRSLAPAAGQCAVGTADDGLMRVRCAMGEYQEAADALARNVVFRRRKGSVPSTFEHATNASALRTLRSRLADDDLRAAFRRAKSAVA